MQNPILQALHQNSGMNQNPVNSNNNMMNVVQAIRMSRNPNLMLQQLAQNNPNVANAMSLIRQYGGDPQKAFFEEAKRRGVDPNQIIGMLR